MKKTIFSVWTLMVLITTSLSANMFSSYLKTDFFNNEKSQEVDFSGSYIPLKNHSITKKKIFASLDCDKEYKRKVFDSCYSFKKKSSLAVAYTIDGRVVNSKNIEERGKWFEDQAVSKRSRSGERDYSHTPYDKGHMAFDSAFDYSYKTMQETYNLTLNAVPQVDTVNRKMWIKSESRAKKLASIYGKVDVVDAMLFSDYPKKTRGGVSIAEGFVKIIENNSKKLQECYYYKNDLNAKAKGDKLQDHRVDCSIAIKEIIHK